MSTRLVTLQSACKGINHVSIHNGPGRLAEATAMLEEVSLAPLSDEVCQAIYQNWLDEPGSATEIDLIRMTEAAIRGLRGLRS